MSGKYRKKIEKSSGILLDIGCGENKQHGFVGMDMRKLDGVDIVHNIEKIPWPLEKESVLQILASHIIEHIDPKKFIPLMDEAWRVLKPDGLLMISMPYGAGRTFQQDPTHCNMANEATWAYFDPEHGGRHPITYEIVLSNLYQIYKPKPWRIQNLVWVPDGSMEVVLVKRSMNGKKP